MQLLIAYFVVKTGRNTPIFTRIAAQSLHTQPSQILPLTGPKLPLTLETVQTTAFKNPRTGLIEILDVKTGAVVAVQRDAFQITAQDLLVEATLPTGEKVMLQKGIDPGQLVNVRSHGYNSVVADLICQKLAEGSSLTKVCATDGFPAYTTICRWRRENPAFKEALEEARRDRSEYMRDLALEEALAADEDSAQSQKLKHEAYKWAAGTDLPERYSAKTKIEGSLNIPMQLVVNTGIIRNEEEYGREIKDATQTGLPIANGSGSTAPAIAASEGAKTGEVLRDPSADEK